MAEIDEQKEQEKMMKELIKKQMIRSISDKIKEGDRKMINSIKKLIDRDDEVDEK